MANQIRITPDQMRERANQYRAEADTVNGVINKMASLLQQLQSEWEGAASVSYATRYAEHCRCRRALSGAGKVAA